MNLKLSIFNIVIFAIYGRVASIPPSIFEIRNGVARKVEESNLETSSSIIKGNNYFQASEQIFNVLDCPRDETPRQNIPKDYVIVPGIGAYKFHSTALSWNDAKNTCIKEGAHLAVIRSAEEDNYIKNVSQDKKISLWLGIHSIFKKDEWVTVHDEFLDSLGNHVPWRTSEPNNAGGNERCVEYNRLTGLNDLSCEQGVHSLPFYCKIDLE